MSSKSVKSIPIARKVSAMELIKVAMRKRSIGSHVPIEITCTKLSSDFQNRLEALDVTLPKSYFLKNSFRKSASVDGDTLTISGSDADGKAFTAEITGKVSKIDATITVAKSTRIKKHVLDANGNPISKIGFSDTVKCKAIRVEIDTDQFVMLIAANAAHGIIGKVRQSAMLAFCE